ncbi:Site-specific recombinase XerD [Ruminococcaceae bacterium YRB3002]|nr:Site-specific recombinase XerD [Ruminococcaceae bacterium YRB3002]
METFPILDNYCNYMLAVLGRSELTVKEYRYDLICFFRFYKKDHHMVPQETEFDQIDISDVDEKLIGRITTDDLLVFLIWLSRERKLSNSSRARRIATLKSFFKYLHSKKHIIPSNPAYDLETPKIGKRNPKYLTLDQSKELLEQAYNSPKETSERDYCIVTLFLNCGMRLSELRGIDIDDIHGDVLTVIGKGNKERTIYLNQACLDAIDEWMAKRATMKIKPAHSKALFISKRGTRISDDMIQIVIKDLLAQAGIDTKVYSVHKLRHTAATLMYKYGQVDIRNLQMILGHQSVSTTQIYTHVDDEQLREAVKKNPLSGFKPDDE